MEDGTAIAEVIRVTRHPVVEIAKGVEVGATLFKPRYVRPRTNTYTIPFL
jgi:hypothetical protein